MDSVKIRRVLKTTGLSALVVLSAWHFLFAYQQARKFNFALDFQIFAQTTAVFSQTGTLYPQADDLEHFDPGTPIYKFPPLLALLIRPFVADGSVTSTVYNGHWILQGVLFLAAALLCLRVTGLKRGWAVAFGILLVNYEPFFETLWRLQLETPILLLLVGCGWALRKRNDLLAGALLGIAVMLKIYPVFLAGYLLFRWRWRALVALASSVSVLLLIEMFLMDVGEIRTYYFRILPYLLSEPPVGGSENVGLARYLIDYAGLAGNVAKRCVQGVMILGLLTFVGLFRRGGEGSSEAKTWLEFGLFISLMLTVMPNSWVNYQLLLVIPLAAIFSELQSNAQSAQRWLPWVALAVLPLLFYQPCADPSVGWPCAQTPSFLGLGALPRGLHDLFVLLRGFSAPLLLAIGVGLHYGGRSQSTMRASSHEA
ncbi:MAG: DUF2029 domain-containing protein [Acidobacteriota bacterium]|nr:DUF2029 domain-containing protein [Acidobacteriota bacterium]MDH3786819.1 DUF2029 domain-containing protein [Acidobacteriota bacterium]